MKIEIQLFLQINNFTFYTYITVRKMKLYRICKVYIGGIINMHHKHKNLRIHIVFFTASENKNTGEHRHRHNSSQKTKLLKRVVHLFMLKAIISIYDNCINTNHSFA